MIEFVFLDLDDTILDFHKAEALALADTLRVLQVEPTQERLALYSRINAAQWRRLEAGEITRSEVLTARFQIFFDTIGVHRSRDEAQRLYESRLSQGHYFIDGALDLLQELSTEYALFLVSNGNLRVQEGRLQSAAIAQYFKEIFISEQVGADKPSRAFFERCFARIADFSQDRAIIVGDSLTSDIRGGINAGIRTCWFNPNGTPASTEISADYEIRSLSELAPLLRSIH